MKYEHFIIEKTKMKTYEEMCKEAGKKYKFTEIYEGEKETVNEKGEKVFIPVYSDTQVDLRIQLVNYEKWHGVELEENTAGYYTQKTIRKIVKHNATVIKNKAGEVVSKKEVLQAMKNTQENPQIIPTMRKHGDSFTLYIDYYRDIADEKGGSHSASENMAKIVYTIEKGDELEIFRTFLKGLK